MKKVTGHIVDVNKMVMNIKDVSMKIPEGWQIVRLKDIATLTSGGTPSKNNPEYWNGEIPWISASSMHVCKVYTSKHKISELGLNNGSRMAKQNTLLLLVRGSMLWKKIPVSLTLNDVAFNQDVKNVIGNSEIDSEFFLYWFLSKNNFLLNRVVGTGIGAGKLDSDDVKSLKILLPPLPEQKAIAELLSTWDRAIEKMEQLIVLKEKRFKWLLHELITKPSKDPEAEKKGWKKVKLGEVLTVCYGKDQKKVEKKNGKHPILGTGGEIGRTDSFLYDKPSVLIGRKGTIDVPRFMDSPFWTVDTLFYTELSERVIPKWMFYKFMTIKWYKYNEASGVPSLTSNSISKIEIYLPSLNIQNKIVKILTIVQQETDLVKKINDKYKTQKNGLMKKMLSSEWRVKAEFVS
jgi:type I restriction enzyme S subunit